MPVRIPIHIAMPPAQGNGLYNFRSAKTIRFAAHGCTNRPFFHIVVTERKRYHLQVPIEQVGSYDPMPNMHNEKLVALNFERINWWVERGAMMSTPVAEMLGLCGYFPIHPRTYMSAWRNRRKQAEAEAEPVAEEKAN